MSERDAGQASEKAARYAAADGPRSRLVPVALGVALLLEVARRVVVGAALLEGLVMATLAIVVLVAPPALLVRDLRRRAWGGAAVAALLTVAGLFLVPGGRLARSMIYPGNPRSLPRAAGALGQGVEVVEYAAADGVALRGLLARAPAPDDGAPVVVVFHGNGEAAIDLLGFARRLTQAGCHAFVAECRGYGGCPGSPSEQGLLADGRAALEAARARLGVERADVVLLGHSLGTGVASLLAAEGAGRRAVLISPYVSVAEVAAGLAPEWLVWLAVPDRYESLAALRARADLPLLIVHGTRDGVIPFAHGRRIAEELASRARLIALEGVGHGVIHGALSEATIAEITSFARAGS